MPRGAVRSRSDHTHGRARQGRHPQPHTGVDRRLQRQRAERHVRQYLVGRRQHAVPGVPRTVEDDDRPGVTRHGGQDHRAARARVLHVDRRLSDGLVVVLPSGVHREGRLRRSRVGDCAVQEHTQHTRVTQELTAVVTLKHSRGRCNNTI